MDSWTPVSRDKHAKSCWLPRPGFNFANKLEVVKVSASEVSALLPHFVFGFIKDSNDKYNFVVLLGAGGGRNLYVDLDGNWLCSQVPRRPLTAKAILALKWQGCSISSINATQAACRCSVIFYAPDKQVG